MASAQELFRKEAVQYQDKLLEPNKVGRPRVNLLLTLFLLSASTAFIYAVFDYRVSTSIPGEVIERLGEHRFRVKAEFSSSTDISIHVVAEDGNKHQAMLYPIKNFDGSERQQVFILDIQVLADERLHLEDVSVVWLETNDSLNLRDIIL
jgi:hydroxymethylpyrimidine pyrophosphatase-like HAD family hydrolase